MGALNLFDLIALVPPRRGEIGVETGTMRTFGMIVLFMMIVLFIPNVRVAIPGPAGAIAVSLVRRVG
jgi:hypothetical protein